ncbi:uncharacterized protein LOC117217746 [Megalopta genalis]|uniref:uncharacterized protein LOC117217746 n=1 Tax=Megalopta genalis TaxID=115081 RepID=UPI003FD4196E
MSTEQNRDSAAMPEVYRESIPVPTFWPEQPALWFLQIEAIFALNGITADATKFYYVVSQLDTKYVAEVEDIFAAPPETEKYETLKRELILRLSASKSKILQLLEQEEIGVRTPSQLLRRMQFLAGKIVSDSSLRTLWASRLPAMTKNIVNALAYLPLGKVAEIADQLQEEAAKNQVASVSTARKDPIERLLDRMEQLEMRIAELCRSRSPKRSYQPNYRGRSKSKDRRRSASPRKKEHCWYHQTFGKRSTRCRPPCTYGAGNAAH